MNRVAVIGIAGNSVFLPVRRFAREGETVEASSVHFEPGGKGFNQAVAAARYGAQVDFLAAVGNGDCRNLRMFLQKEGINAALISKAEETAFAAIVTDEEGKNAVTVYQGARLTLADVKNFETQIAEADILLLTNETEEYVNIEAVKTARKYSTRIILNPAPARKISDYILNAVDLFTPNEHEAFCVESLENVIVTLGDKGCLLKKENRILSAPAVEAVDTTGAGDTFNGVLAALLASGIEAEPAAAAANKAAALEVTRKYAVSSIPTKEETEKFFQMSKDNKKCKED